MAQQEEKKYLSESGLLRLVELIKSGFAKLTHSHTLEDITDYKVDTELSIESTNTVQNKIITVEINRINETLSGTAYIDEDDDETVTLSVNLPELASLIGGDV